MSQKTRSVLSAILSFGLSAVVAFAVGGFIRSDEVPPAGLPTFEAPEPVVIPTPVGDSDLAAFAAAYVEDLQESRELASAAGVSLAPDDGVEGASVAGGTSGDSDSPEPGAEVGAETGGSGGIPSGADSAEERFVDICADGGDECPEGVGGTILLAIRDVPLFGRAAFDPPVPGAGSGYASAVCPADAAVEDRLLLGVSTSRPVEIEVGYRAGRWTGSSYEVEGNFEITTSDVAEALWDEWLADESIPNTDPRAFAQHCVTMPDLPPRGDYLGFIRLTDKYDPSATYMIPSFRFVVRNEGLVPGAQRRPTFLLGYGIDDLRVGVTSTSEQTVAIAAIPDGTPGVCDTGGVDRSVIDLPDAVAGRVLTDEPIAEDVIGDPGYPYFTDHTRSIVHRVGLQEGTDYIVCIYWFGPGPSFDASVVEIAEEVEVSTPEAYRPRLTLHDVANLFGGPERIGVRVVGCDLFEIEDLVVDRSGALDWVGGPQEMCTLDENLTEMDRGIRVTTGVRLGDGSEGEHRPFIRTNLECDTAPCLLRLNELAVVPLPDVPTERRLCGTGFGGGCDGEVPMRSAGDVVIEIAYIDVPGNGRTDWSISEVGEFEDTPPALAEIPQLDVTALYEMRGSPDLGAQANISVVADRPVSLQVEVAAENRLGGSGCRVDEFPSYDEPELAQTHSFVFAPLCLGAEYRLLVTARDAAGVDGVVVARFSEPAPHKDIVVPGVWGGLDLTATISAPSDSARHWVAIREVYVHPQTVVPPFSRGLDWSMSPAARFEAQRVGWNVVGFYDQIHACGLAPGVGPLVVDTRTTSRPYSLLGQQDILLRIEADIGRLHPVGGIYGECARDEIVESIEIQGTVSLADLWAGVTLTSDSGSATITLRLATWRRELVG
jgi:hypothetical protein